MFAGSAFAILLAALLIVGIPALVLVNTGVLSIGEGGLLTFNQFMVLMALVLSVFGIAFSFIFGRLFMKSINTIINMMNRLARGQSINPELSLRESFQKTERKRNDGQYKQNGGGT